MRGGGESAGFVFCFFPSVIYESSTGAATTTSDAFDFLVGVAATNLSLMYSPSTAGAATFFGALLFDSFDDTKSDLSHKTTV